MLTSSRKRPTCESERPLLGTIQRVVYALPVPVVRSNADLHFSSKRLRFLPKLLAEQLVGLEVRGDPAFP